MKKFTKIFTLLLFTLLYCSPNLLLAQCGTGETYNTYCYDDGEVNIVAFEFCPTAGSIAQSTIIAGTYGIGSPFPATIEGLTVYEGTSGSGATGTVVFGPANGDLTGTVITASTPDLCLIFVSNSNTFFIPSGCIDGFNIPLEVCSESLAGTTVTFTAPADLCINAGVQTGLGGGSPTGGVYSGLGVTDDGNGSTYSFDPAAAGVGVHTLTYTNVGSASDDIEVLAVPTVTFTAPADLCIDAGVQTGQGGASPGGGVYSGPGVTDDGNGSTYSFNPAAAGLGVHTITYTEPTCMATASDQVEVLAACGCPPSFTSSHFHCSTPPEVNLVIFEVCPSAGQAAQATINQGTYSAGFGNNLSIYEGASGSGTSGTLLAGPLSGDLTGTVISGNGADNCLIFVSNVPGVGCNTGFETALKVCGEDISPSVSFMALEDLCIDAGVETGLGGGLPTGGVYSGAGVTDDGNGMTYSFDPAAAGVGVHTLTYTVTGNSAMDDVEVFALGTAGCVSFTALADLCSDAGVQTGLGGGTPTGGVYSGSGVTDNGNGMTYSFDPAAAGVGVHTLTYTSGGFPVTDEVEVFGSPTVTLNILTNNTICVLAGVTLYAGFASPSGGTFSGTGVNDLGTGSSFTFDPSIGVGTYNVVYSYTDGNGCTGVDGDFINVVASSINFTAPADLCLNSGVQNNLGGGTPTGGVYSGPGVSDDGNGMTYDFDPAAAGVGIHTLMYTATDGTCTGTASDDVEVGPAVIVTCPPTDPASVEGCSASEITNSSSLALSLVSAPIMETEFNAEGGTISPMGAATISYIDVIVSAQFSCPFEVTRTFTVVTPCGTTTCVQNWVIEDTTDPIITTCPPDLTTTGCTAEDLINDPAIAQPFSTELQLITLNEFNAEGGAFMDNCTPHSMIQYQDVATTGPCPVVTRTFTVTDICGNPTQCTQTITIDAPPVVLTCQADTTIVAFTSQSQIDDEYSKWIRNMNNPSGTSFTGGCNGILSNDAPAMAPDECGGSVMVTWTVMSDCGVANETCSATFTVTPSASTTFVAPADLCIDAGVQAGLGGGTPSGGVYSGPGVTDDANGMTYSFDPAAAGVGTHTLTYTFTDSRGCTYPANDVVEVFAKPAATFMVSDISGCEGNGTCVGTSTEITPMSSSGNLFKFYDADPAGGMAVLIGGPAASFDPMTSAATSPQSVWVAECLPGACDSEAEEVVITIVANPTPTLMVPTFPTSLSCQQAETYMADPATFTNGLTGACENSGSVTASLIPAFSACGGNIKVTYNGTDNCGNSLFAGPFTIPVDPAPPVMTTVPTFPATLDCEMAAAFTAADLTFENGIATGPCSNSGSIQATVVNTATSCLGGTITITYTGVDNCGNAISEGPFTITVTPPPPAILTTPTLPTTLSCVLAENYMAPEASFTNGLMGTCENSGTIQATQVNNFTACGGTITVSYSGLDDCGNTLSAGPFTINVDPAPAPTVTAPPYSSPISCEQAANYVVLDATYTNGLSGICNISGNLPGTISNNFDACGGTITLTYAGFDPCQRPISIPPIVIEVQPAPVPMITPPALPSSIACDAAADYMPPNATYSNGLTGVCNLSGTATSFVNRYYDGCGGTLEIIYEAEDDCGRNIPKNITIIPVDPAPVPTVNVPAYPASLTCSEAEALTGAYATYDNGQGDDCNISGFLAPTVLKQVDACTGGTVTISYNGMDDCGNVLSAAPIVIPVTPAGPATIHLPQDASPIYCWEALEYIPENAKYTNGESGFCENSGELVATTVVPYWNNCDGGVFMVQYTGFDDCGNYLESDFIAISVLPDIWAPIGTCVDVSEQVEDIKNIPGPNELGSYLDMILASYSDFCGTVVINLVSDSGEPVCGLDGTFARVYEVQVADECGNTAESCTITFSGECNPLYCTLSQDFYASPMEQFGGLNANVMINELIGNGNNPITVGTGACGFTLDNTACIQAALAGEGQSIALPNPATFNCGDLVNNNLINQVITTILNIRYNAQLNAGGLDYGNFQLDAACIYIPEKISQGLPANATINDLIDYANAFIGCQCTASCGEYQPVMGELTGIFLGLNSRFNKCQVPDPCFLEEQGGGSGNDFVNPNFGLAFENAKDRMGVTLFPNPTDRVLNVKFNEQEMFGRPGVVEIFNIHGVKVLEQSFDALTGDPMNFDLYGFSNGVFWLTVKIDGYKQITEKFLITRL